MKRGLLTLGSAFVVGAILFFSMREKEVLESTAFPEPRYPPVVPRNISDDELRALAKRLVRVREGETPFGNVDAGQKVLFEIPQNQDMRILSALIEAYRERGVEAHYAYSRDIVKETLGIGENEAYQSGILLRGPAGGGSRGPRDGSREAFAFLSLLPEKERKEAIELRREVGFNIQLDENAERDSAKTYRKALKKYITELHPEYDAFFGGRPLRVYMASEVGPKWKGYFYAATLMDRAISLASRFPGDVWHLVVERTIEVVPWVEEARITEPQGTDIRFSLTPQEAELWSKGTYHVGQVYLYPFQGTRLLYITQGYKGQVVPKAEGVVAGTSNHNGYYPLIKVYVKDGKAQGIEGGGKYGAVWSAILNNEKVKNLHFPFLPDKGFFWVCEGIPGTNPKALGGVLGGVGELYRAGIFRFGFGVGNLAPEVEEYARKMGVPNTHGFHVHQYFTTYDVKTRGSARRLKIIDKGHLTALDDPEVRALASRYGEADQLLREDWIPAIPGINTKGDFMRDFGSDPLLYRKREVQLLSKQGSL
ncbi:MAG: hypothetical protein HY315_08245 [Acidobacteria bacterium]|nr:hypothetical protein [Acidobacteriota bacterium]